jgi:hypothetical protein
VLMLVTGLGLLTLVTSGLRMLWARTLARRGRGAAGSAATRGGPPAAPGAE